MVTVFEFGGPNTYRGAKTKSLIQADQQESGDFLFDVTYGLEVKTGLSYSQACKAIGQAILHLQCCEGIASNEGCDMRADTFWTIEYKQHWIHGHYDRDLKKEVIRIQCPHGSIYDAKSLHAAKYRITSFLRSRA